MNIKRCKHSCIANFNGECAVKECKGALIISRNSKSISKDAKRKLYEISMKMFEEDFREG